MTPRAQAFAATWGSAADAVSRGTGINPTALLIQWAVETAFGSAVNNRNNPGNIRCVALYPCLNGFAQFPSVGDFQLTATSTWNNGYYGAVLVTASTGGSIDQQLVAIGESPWDAGHYNNGGGPGSSLLAIAPEFGVDDVGLENYPGDQLAGQTSGGGEAAFFDRFNALYHLVNDLESKVGALQASVTALEASKLQGSAQVTVELTPAP